MSDEYDRLYLNAARLIRDALNINTSLGMEMSLDDFEDAFICPTWDFGEPPATQFFYEYKATVEEKGEENSRHQRFILVRLACAHIGEALRFADDGFRETAWECLLCAEYTTAKLAGVIEAEKNGPDDGGSHIKIMLDDHAKSIISDRARQAADAAHATNRTIRKEAYQWLEDHFHQDGLTNDRAAEALQKIVPMELSTRLDYVKKWKQSR